jgi:hypothetical protein
MVALAIEEEDAVRTTVLEKRNTGKKGPRPKREAFPVLDCNIGWFAALATLIHAIPVSIAAGWSRCNTALRDFDHHSFSGEQEPGD